MKHQTITTLTLLFIIATATTFTFSCAQSCNCYNSSTIVDCSRRQLLSLPRHLPASATTFNIANNHLGPFVNGTLSRLRNLTDLDLSHNGIVRITGCCFKGLFKLKRLNLRGNQMRILQEDLFSDNTDLEFLDLSGNKLETLQEPAFKYLRNLKELYLSDNYFTRLKFGVRLQVLTNVEVLDLSYNNFGHVSHDAFEMIQPWSTSVKRSLNLANCQITSIENGTLSTYNGLHELILSGNKDLSVENLTNVLLDLQHKRLKRLDISYMDLISVDTLFVNTQYLALEHLNLSHNLISSVGNVSFNSIQHLNSLDLSFNNLSNFCYEFSTLTNLKTFDVSHNNISFIDGSLIEPLSGLQVFNASYNNLQHRSDVQLSSVRHLKHLDLSHNQLDGIVLPGSISEMEVLNFAHNKISVLELLPSATKLIKLDVSYNNISIVGPFVFTATRMIKEVNFRGNVIHEVDHQAFVPNNPEVIDLSGNRLTWLKYCSWSDVLQLNLSNNRISKVDYQAFYTMNKLKVLDLSNNRIETLHSETFRHLTNVKHLNLSHNKLRMRDEDENLAELFQSLYSLTDLDMSFNDLTFINSTSLKVSVDAEVISLSNNKFPYILPSLFSELKKLKQIDLSHNPFDCGCELISLANWIKQNENILLVNDSNTSYICDSPYQRAGLSILNYNTGTFECSIHLLFLTIFGSISVLLFLVVLAGGFLCHYYLKWRREDLPKIKMAAAAEKEAKIDRVRVSAKSDIEAFPDDLMSDIDKHVRLNMKPLQNGDVPKQSSTDHRKTHDPSSYDRRNDGSPVLNHVSKLDHSPVHDDGSDYNETSKKLSFSQPNLDHRYNSYVYPVFSDSSRWQTVANGNHRPHGSLPLANSSSYPYSYGLAKEFFILDEKKKKKIEKEMEQREKERKKREKKEKEEREKERKRKEKEKKRKEKKFEERSRHHHKRHPWRASSLDRYQPSARWDPKGRDQWQILQWNALNKRYHDGRLPDRSTTLPPPNKMAYHRGYPVYPPLPRDRSHSLRPPAVSRRSQSSWELPDGWFARRATLPDARLGRESLLQSVQYRRHSEENERRRRRMSQEYRNWRKLNEECNPEENYARQRPSEMTSARCSPTEVTFDPVLLVRSNVDLREKVKFQPYRTDLARQLHHHQHQHHQQHQQQQKRIIPRSRSEIVYSGPSEDVWEDRTPHVSHNELSKSVSVSEYGIERIADRDRTPGDVRQRQEELAGKDREHVHDSRRVLEDRSTSPSTKHTAEVHVDDDDVVRTTPDPDYPREGIISGWV